MPIRLAHNIKQPPDRDQVAELRVIETRERKTQDRERFLDHLARRQRSGLGCHYM